MASPDIAAQKFEIITRRLQEVLGADTIKAILAEGRSPTCYWGKIFIENSTYRTTYEPILPEDNLILIFPMPAHIGYFVPLTKIADFLSAGVEVKVLLADVHAFLDNLKAPIELVEHRTKYYEYILRAVFHSLDIPTAKLHFVTGSSYQLTKEYNMDKFKICSIVTEHDAKKAGAEVVKQVDSPLLSGLIYPCMQALDEQYLGVDFQFGGVDQRKIFTFAEKYLPALGYKKRAHLMNTMVPGLQGAKMSSSDPNSKIDFLDAPEVVKKKIKLAFCEEGNVTENGLLSFVEAVVIPISQLRIAKAKGDPLLAEGSKEGPAHSNGNAFVGSDAPEGTVFTVERDPKFGTALHYSSFEQVKADFAAKNIHPKDLKNAVTNAVASLLDPIRKELLENPDFVAVEKAAYPPPAAANDKKKVKKGQGQPASAPPADDGPPKPSMIDLRVGKIIDVKKHPDADSLYVEQIDLGEATGPRTVVSGLVKYVPIEEMQGRQLVVVANLKPANMRGVKSQAMVLCATHKDGKDAGIEIVSPPPNSKPGDRAFFEGEEYENATPVSQLNPKKKVFETIQPGLITLESKECAWINPETKSVHRIMTKEGAVVAPNFVGGTLS
ncbi:tyrosine--tRNA ligase, cytoplasmic [Flagelloscypha sp. PMI_526]|nr:tyrosine--tRNA ligase, cytoplasmic [Flagelloscypha sp. PMI_526]